MRQRQKGMSIIELMISIALGLLILVAATAMTVKSLVMNTDTLASAKLNQDIDSVTQVMVNDIRRAGYSGGHFLFADNEDLNIVSSSCILYAYNANDDPPGSPNLTLDDNEKFGFKLNGSEVEMRTTCTGAGCATDCDAGTWVALTDDAVTTITNLNFHSSKSKCISLTATANVVAESNTNNYWVTDILDESLTVTQFPCMATTGAGLSTFTLDSTGVYVASDFFPPQDNDRLNGVRLVNVEIAGRLTNDITVTKSQEVEINVRNDHVQCINFACP